MNRDVENDDGGVAVNEGVSRGRVLRRDRGRQSRRRRVDSTMGPHLALFGPLMLYSVASVVQVHTL